MKAKNGEETWTVIGVMSGGSRQPCVGGWKNEVIGFLVRDESCQLRGYAARVREERNGRGFLCRLMTKWL